MAPWHWCAMPAPSPAASPARILAAAISNAASPASIVANARWAAMPAAAVCPARSASWCWMAWNDASGRRSWTRSVTYLTDCARRNSRPPAIWAERASAPAIVSELSDSNSPAGAAAGRDENHVSVGPLAARAAAGFGDLRQREPVLLEGLPERGGPRPLLGRFDQGRRDLVGEKPRAGIREQGARLGSHG